MAMLDRLIKLDSSNPPETVETSLKENLVKIKALHDVRANPSLKESVQDYEFINNQQKFTLHITFNEKGIACEYEDANIQFRRPAAPPIQKAVEAIFNTQLASKIGEQACQNILGDAAGVGYRRHSVFHHEESSSQKVKQDDLNPVLPNPRKRSSTI